MWGKCEKLNSKLKISREGDPNIIHLADKDRLFNSANDQNITTCSEDQETTK